MAWSTRELAELAGTTLRTVRYYHEVGLLDPPERAVNGYKQYGVAHLIRLLRIRRLLDLGMTLDEVRGMGDLDAHPESELRRLDDQARAAIEQLERVRDEIGELVESPVPIDLPAELARVATTENVTVQDLKLLSVMSRIFDARELAELVRLVASSPVTAAGRDLERLSEDASEEVRDDLARRLLPELLEAREKFPGMPDYGPDSPDTPQRRAYLAALTEVYSPAQRDVLARASRMRHGCDRD